MDKQSHRSPDTKAPSSPIVLRLELGNCVVETRETIAAIQALFATTHQTALRIPLKKPRPIRIHHGGTTVYEGMVSEIDAKEERYGDFSDVLIVGLIDANRQAINVDALIGQAVAIDTQPIAESLPIPPPGTSRVTPLVADVTPKHESPASCKTAQVDTVVARGTATDTVTERLVYGPLTTAVGKEEELYLRATVGQLAYAEKRDVEQHKRKATGWATWMCTYIIADLAKRQPNAKRPPAIIDRADVTVLASMMHEIIVRQTIGGQPLGSNLAKLPDVLTRFATSLTTDASARELTQLQALLRTAIDAQKHALVINENVDQLAGYGGKQRSIRQIQAYLDSNSIHQVEIGVRLFLDTGMALATRAPNDASAREEHFRTVASVVSDIDGGLHLSHKQKDNPRHGVHVAVGRVLQRISNTDKNRVLQRVDEVRSSLAKRGIKS